MKHVVVVGAGPVGCVLSIILARRGFRVTAYEKRRDLRVTHADAGRSINLVLTRRGLRVLALLGLRDAVLELTVPVLGRMMHAVDGALAYQPYGKDDSECNYAVSRATLNEFLLDAAEAAGVAIHFQHKLVDANLDGGALRFATSDGEVEVTSDSIFGCDGGGSAVRRAMVDQYGIDEAVEWLEHSYKELEFPLGEGGVQTLRGDALHIWPRGDHMLMALANLDGSFTGTLYLPNEGPDGFASVTTLQDAVAFLQREYASALDFLAPDSAERLANAPLGHLATTRCGPWHHGDRVLLVGDAAHAIVPFFGQGLNCGLEDCAVFWELTEGDARLADVFEKFYAARKANADAIAQMALENFVEMRDKVGDAQFLLRKAIERRIERERPDLYRSRYATVMYSTNPYAAALRAGEVQSEILQELAQGVTSADEVDLYQAWELIAQRLTPTYLAEEIDLSF